MNCNDFIKSEDVEDFILEWNSYDRLFDESKLCIEKIDNSWMIIHNQINELGTTGIGSYGYSAIPKLYAFTDSFSTYDLGSQAGDYSVLEEMGIVQVKNQPNLNANGQGILLGFLDTGIDYLDSAFIDKGTGTRIDVIWDQTLEWDPLNDFDNLYGKVYEKSEIDRAIEAYALGMNPYEIVETKDEDKHGTILARLACGKNATFTGVATESRIAVVKLKPAKKYLKKYFCVNEAARVFQENDIMTGIYFLKEYAKRRNMPLVILNSLVTAQGARTGTAPLADLLNSVAKNKGTSVVACVGDEGNERTHYEGTMDTFGLERTVEINVEENGAGLYTELWCNGLDVLSVAIESPSGENVPRIPAKNKMSSIFYFLYEGTEISVEYAVPEEKSGLECIVIRFIKPAKGIWKLKIYNVGNIKSGFNIWMQSERLSSTRAYFFSSSPEMTLCESACAARVISVGVYNHYTGAMLYESGRGYTLDGRIKPDLIAPGVEIFTNISGRITGTGAGAALVAGVVAILFSWGITEGNYIEMGNNEAKVTLIRGAIRMSDVVYPNRLMGYGKINIFNTFNQLRIG